jgi:hypothetical protein
MLQTEMDKSFRIVKPIVEKYERICHGKGKKTV